MPKYMLDADMVSFALRGHGRVADRILRHPASDLCLSSIALSGLRFGAEIRPDLDIHRQIDRFIASVEVAPFDQAAADRFASVAAALRRKGEPIGTFDTLMAAQALSMGLVFVTNNAKHFQRVHGLRTESWV